MSAIHKLDWNDDTVIMSHTLLSRFQGSLAGSFVMMSDAEILSWRDRDGCAVWRERLTLALSTQFPRAENTQESASQDSLVITHAIANLPLHLLSHEHPARLQTLLPSAASEPAASLVLPLLTFWQHCLIASLRQQLVPDRALTEACTTLPLLTAIDPAWGWAQVRRKLGADSSSVEFTAGAIAAALFCFLTTPEAPSIAVRRANGYSPLARQLCAILAGAQHGLGGLQQALTLALPDDFAGFVEQLWQSWTGQYPGGSRRSLGAIAVDLAHTLQPRSRRPLISLRTPSTADL